MNCPECKEGILKVKYSRLRKDGIRARSKSCERCGYKISTLEVSRLDYERDRILVGKLKRLIKEYIERGSESNS